ncbi:MAG: AAA family ATPase [Sphaerochaetaceae bacterium]|jgi:predicted ATPase|nr:AAA family ATPase [Sphaerochaetaceae bacterium]
MRDLYLKKVIFALEDCKDSFYKNLPAFKGIRELSFSSPITFFSGENGSGKSTLLEAIALGLGLNAEGGTRNYRFETYNDTCDMYRHIRLCREAIAPSCLFFRSETFYNLATKAKEYAEDDPLRRNANLHELSHGQSFMQFIAGFDRQGLFLMDEPESALSTTAQMSLICFIHDMAEKGSQFIIATHSAILLGTPGSQILDFDSGMQAIKYEETSSYRLTRRFLDARARVLEDLLGK